RGLHGGGLGRDGGHSARLFHFPVPPHREALAPALLREQLGARLGQARQPVGHLGGPEVQRFVGGPHVPGLEQRLGIEPQRLGAAAGRVGAGEAGERGAQGAEHCSLHQSMSHATRPPGPARPPPRPLAGRRIAVTRAREQAAELVRELEALGAQVVVAPTIRISPLTDLAALRAALTRNPPYDWIVFTSQNAVHVVCDRLPEWQLAPRDVARAAVAAIGPATAEALVRRGVVPDLVPDRFVAEAVVTALAAQGDVRGKTGFLPRARGALVGPP